MILCRCRKAVKSAWLILSSAGSIVSHCMLMFGSKKEILKYCKNGYIEMNNLESNEISLIICDLFLKIILSFTAPKLRATLIIRPLLLIKS